MLDESNSKCLSTFQPGRSLFRTSLLLLNNKYRSLSSERHLSSIIQRGFLDVRMHCFHNALSLYSVVKVLYYGPLSRPAGAWLLLLFQFPVEAAISDQKAPVSLSGFWSKSLLGRYKKEFYIKMSGTRLFFHTVSSIVPSAVQVLTVVFGMGTGVAPARIGTRQI